MDASYFDLIYKRKSFHRYGEPDGKKITPEELDEIREMWYKFTPLFEGIKTKIKIVPGEQTSCNRGEEYCILIYSEKKPGYLQNIGYIGELIYEQYLKNAKIKYDYAAARGVGDYDFSLDAVDSRPKTYVDVKTNLYSFKEEAVPFYIHKSQNRFMQEHPEEPFRIVRISLTDLDLNKSYERMRDLYGPETDYEASEELREYCQKIARDYWRKARIEEFDAASPEYGIKIERLPR